MHLPEIGCLWIPPRQVTVPHKRSVMHVTFDAMAARQCDRWSRRLAEAMLAVDRHSDHRALGGGVLPCGMSDFLDSDTFAERPVQADDREVKERRKRHPEQVGQEKPIGQ